MRKRALIVGHAFLEPAMGGVRLRRISRLLPRLGWDTVVLTQTRNANSVPDLPEGVRFEEVAARDLARLYHKICNLGRREARAGSSERVKQPMARDIGLTSKLNRWVMIPDKQVTWYRPALCRGRELLQRENFDVIFASLEPRTCLLVGAELSKETGVPCVLEYRDLWVGNPYYHLAQPTALHNWIHLRLERKALRQAKRVSALSRGIADHLFQAHGSLLRSPIALNYNFFDPEEYSAISVRSGPRPFTISYTGALYASRSPHQFFEGMRAFLNQTGLTPDQFRFRWAGSIAGVAGLSGILDRAGVRPYLDFLGQIPHREALQLLADSDASLLVQSPDDVIHIPGKLFEAMGARVPLLALANACETTQIIERCRAGIVCSHTAAAVAAGLAEFHRLCASGKQWQFNELEVLQFSAGASAGRVAALLEEALT